MLLIGNMEVIRETVDENNSPDTKQNKSNKKNNKNNNSSCKNGGGNSTH